MPRGTGTSRVLQLNLPIVLHTVPGGAAGGGRATTPRDGRVRHLRPQGRVRAGREPAGREPAGREPAGREPGDAWVDPGHAGGSRVRAGADPGSGHGQIQGEGRSRSRVRAGSDLDG